MKNNLQKRFVSVALVVTAILVLVIPAVVGAAAAPMKQLSSQVQIDDEIARFQREAKKAGYVMQEGRVGVFDLDRKYCDYTVWTADWPNPSSPYISAGIPTVPGQAAAHGINVFRLREDEAVVVIGVTPPPMAYFNFNFHMFRGSRRQEFGPPILWIPATDPVNSLTLRTTGLTPFDQPFAVVATGHRQTQAEVHQMLRAAGLGVMTNDQVISPSLFRLGLDTGSDEFGFAMRTAVPESRDALNSYLAALANDDPAARPVRIFRVRPKSVSDEDQVGPVLAPDPLPTPPLRVAGTGSSELDLNPTLQLLRQCIIDTYPGYTATDLRVDPWFDEPYPGLQRDMVTDMVPGGPYQDGVAGATSDATYLASANFTLPDGAFLVAYGAHHRATGKAAYSSVSIYADAVATVSQATAQSPDQQGSARDYIADQPNADMFYAWTFTRASGSGASHTTQIPAADFCQTRYPGTDRPVDLHTLRVGYRAYMEPATGTHPAEAEMLFDRLLMFIPK